MKLREIQQRMFRAITEPLTPSERMRTRGLDGRSLRKEAEAIIRPNERLSSLERLEIYNRQYWFRLLGSLYDDFPGLEAILGERRFEKLAQAYLLECPSRSHTLRDLGNRLERWLKKNPEFAGDKAALALDMIRLEWANIEAFDAEQLPRLSKDGLFALSQHPDKIGPGLQPHLRLVKVDHPVDEIRLAVKDGVAWTPVASQAVSSSRGRSVRHRFSGLRRERLHLAVHRQENMIYYKRIDREVFRLLSAFERGKTLSLAVGEMFVGSRLPESERIDYIRETFAHLVSLGWFRDPLATRRP